MEFRDFWSLDKILYQTINFFLQRLYCVKIKINKWRCQLQFCYDINKEQVQCKFISEQQYLKYEVHEQASKTTL